MAKPVNPQLAPQAFLWQEQQRESLEETGPEKLLPKPFPFASRGRSGLALRAWLGFGTFSLLVDVIESRISVDALETRGSLDLRDGKAQHPLGLAHPLHPLFSEVLFLRRSQRASTIPTMFFALLLGQGISQPPSSPCFANTELLPGSTIRPSYKVSPIMLQSSSNLN